MKTISPFQIVSSRIRKLSMAVGQISPGAVYKTTYTFKCSSPDVNESDEEYYGKIAFCVVAVIKSDNAKLMNVTLDMEGSFRTKKDDQARTMGIDLNKFLTMIDMNGLVALSQIARATLLSITSLSGIQPGLMMPMLNINELKKQRRIN